MKVDKEALVRKVVLGLGLLMASVVYADVVSQNGIAKDGVTGLIWQDEPYSQQEKEAYDNYKNYGKAGNWEYAKQYCKELRLGGFSDWRLPNIYELVTLIDNTKKEKPYSINGLLQNVASNVYWSSTTDAGDASTAWVVDFSFGSDVAINKSGRSYVRCVRGGQVNFETLSSLKKQGGLKVDKKKIDEISPSADAKRKKETVMATQKVQKQVTTTRSYNSWKTGYIYHRPDSYAPSSYKSTEIQCSDGTKGTVFDYYNRDVYSRYLANAAKSFSQFEEAANYICGNR